MAALLLRGGALSQLIACSTLSATRPVEIGTQALSLCVAQCGRAIYVNESARGHNDFAWEPQTTIRHDALFMSREQF